MKKNKFTKEQIKKLKVFWESQKEATNRYLENINAIEWVMSDNLGIEGLEFFWSEGYIVGIGDFPITNYELLQDEELTKEGK